MSEEINEAQQERKKPGPKPGSKAAHNPVVIRKGVDVEQPRQEQVLGNFADGQFQTLSEIGFETEIDYAAQGKEKHRQDLAFNEEMIEVEVAAQSSEADDPVFPVSVNGKTFVFIRGAVQQVKRYFVEQAMRSKVRSCQSVKTRNPDSEERYEQHTSMRTRFPLQILHDPSPRAAAWRTQVMRQA